MRLFIKQIRPTFAAASLVAMMGLPAERAAQDLDYSIDALIDREAADIDPEDIALLVLLRRDPLDINRADRTELEQLPWITPALAGAIVAWRERHGPFGNAGELVRVQDSRLSLFPGSVPSFARRTIAVSRPPGACAWREAAPTDPTRRETASWVCRRISGWETGSSWEAGANAGTGAAKPGGGPDTWNSADRLLPAG